MKRYTITVNGIAYEVAVEEKLTSEQPMPTPVQTSTVSSPVPTSKPATPTPKMKEISAGSLGNIKIESPMPGKILAIKALIGQAVKKGDVILVLEAMKMENEIVAPSDGTVTSINVTEGSMIESGILLASLTE